MKRRALIYCRISQDREGAGLGVDRQRLDCEQLAERLGWRVVGVHTDNDLSAYSGKPRPGYQALLEDLRNGVGSAVLAWHTDRLHRSQRELEDYVAVCETHNVVTQTVQAGELDLATPSGRAIARTLGAWARFESEHKSERIKSAHQQAAKAGRWRGGGRPFGYLDDAVTLHPDEAPAIARAYRQLLAGSSMRSVIREWNEAGLTSTTGKPWVYQTFRQVMLRPRNYGASVYRGEVVGMGSWTPIVDEATWRGVEAILNNPARKGGSNRARWLLSGIAQCGVCGNTVKISTASERNGKQVNIYRCKTGSHIGRRADYCDTLVAAAVVERLAEDDAAELLVSDDVDRDALVVEARAIRAQLDEAANLWADGTLTSAQLRSTKQRLQNRLTGVEARLASGQRGRLLGDVVGPDAESRWFDLSIDRRRAIVAELVDVTLAPVPRDRQRRFHEDTVHVSFEKSVR